MSRYLLLLLFFCTYLSAQTTSISATVTDSDGQTWNNGIYTLQFIPNPSQPNLSIYNINGVPLDQSLLLQKGVLSNIGVLSTISIYDNTLVSPVGSSWQLTLCPQASVQCSVLPSLVIQGTSMDLSSFVDINIKPPRFPASGANQYGYLDVEISPIPLPGGFYYNVTNPCIRVYDPVAGWGCVNNGRPGCIATGPDGAIQYNTGGACTGGAGLTTNTGNELFVGSIGYAPAGMIDIRSKACQASGDFQGLSSTATTTTGGSSNIVNLSGTVPSWVVTGMTVVIQGAGNNAGTALVSTITSVGTTSITLSSGATTALAGTWIGIGHDDSTAFNNCAPIAAAQNKYIYLPTPAIIGASYLVTKSLNYGNLRGVWIVGDRVTLGFNISTITHALTEPFPVLDFSGGTRIGIAGIAIVAANNNLNNSFATAGWLSQPAVGGNFPINFSSYDSYSSAGNSSGTSACVLVGQDQSTIDHSICTSNYAGLVVGNGYGTATNVVSKFYTTGPGPGDTLIRVDNSQISGSLDTPLQLEGSDTFQVGGNTYVVEVGPGTASCLMEVHQAAGFEPNFLEMLNIRTENQNNNSNIETALCFNGNFASRGGHIEGAFNTGGAGNLGSTFGVLSGAGVMLNYDINIETTANTLFNNIGGMANTNIKFHGNGNAPPNFGTIGSGTMANPVLFSGNNIYSNYSLATVLAGIPATFGLSTICTSGISCTVIGAAGQSFSGPVVANNSLTVNGGTNLNGSTTIAGSIGLGNSANEVQNSFNFSAGTWTVTGSPALTCLFSGSSCSTATAVADGYSGTTGTQIITSSSTTLTNNNSGTPLPSATFLACAHIRATLGTETGTINSFGLSQSFTFTATLANTPATNGYAWYCSTNSRNINLTQVANITFPSGETLLIDGFMVVPVGPFSGSFTALYTGPTPAYVATGTNPVTSSAPSIGLGNTTSLTATGLTASQSTFTSTTFANLPAASSNMGTVRVINDSTAITAEGQACAGGSSNFALAFSNGTTWRCF